MAKPKSKKPWNAGKVVGPKKPLDRESLNALRRILKGKEKLRDLALLEVAVTTMLRGCDLLQLRVRDVAGFDGGIVDRFTLRQKKTKEGVVVTLSDAARAALEAWIAESDKDASDFLFTAKSNHHGPAMTTKAFWDLTKAWAQLIHVDPKDLGTHSLRRTQAAHIYKRTGSIRTVQKLLGHSSHAATERYLGIEVEDALELKRLYEI
ncbi:MAG: tyrosine-type recombinase/integrase [Alphaproteobacteria bacterium]|nr:tyrosine-type recombinase/integrase [Alphaproteobacteria bacterium]